MVWVIRETASSGSILILTSPLLTQKALIHSSDHNVSHLLHKNLYKQQRLSLIKTLPLSIPILRGSKPLSFVFVLFFIYFFLDKTISASFFLKNLMISLSLWSEGKRWQASRLSGVIEIPVAVSINSHTLVLLVVSGIPTISSIYRREYCSFFQHCL